MTAPVITTDLVIQKYIETRDILEAKKKAFDAECKALKDLQEKRELFLLGALDKIGASSVKTTFGTAFVDWKDSATVADGAAFMEWVHDNWEDRKTFLENRVSKTAVKQLLEDKEPLPPGINYSKIKDIKVRRS